MFQPLRRGRRRSALIGLAVAATAALGLTACSPGGSSSKDAANSGTGPMTVWVDATRAPLVQAYAKAHPTVKIDVVTVDSAALESKLSLLASNPGQQPDVVYTPNGQGVTFGQKYGYSTNLSSLVTSAVKKGFGSTLSACTDPKTKALDCLPGDISTQMLFYNAKLFAKFGYTVPTTWDAYQKLSERIAAEHPGYVTGSCGDGFCPNVYYRASDCPGVSVKDTAVSVGLSSNVDCTRVTSMLDPLIKNKTVATLSPFDPDMATLGKAQKILMLPGFVWYGELLFQQTFKNPAGTVGIAPLPTWEDGLKGKGAAVGGQWIVGSHTSHQKAATALIVDMTTDSKSLATAVTFPAFAPAVSAWVSKAVASGFYAGDAEKTITSARSDVTGDLYAVPALNILDPFSSTVAPKLKSGSSLSSQIDAWQAAVVQAAGDAGYTVSK